MDNILIPSVESSYSQATLTIKNFNEVSKAISSFVKKYENLEITNESEIADAKKDLADLRKTQRLIDDERKAIKKEILLSFEIGEKQYKDLASLLDNAIQNIDSQLKEYDSIKQQEKRKEIEAIFNEQEKLDFITLESIFNEKWLNKTYSLENIKSDIIEKITKISNDIQSLKQLIEDPKEFALAQRDYVQNYDLNYTIEQHMGRKKALDTLQIKEEIDKKIEKEENKIYKIAFAIQTSKKNIDELAKWLNSKNISFKQIKDKELINKVLEEK